MDLIDRQSAIEITKMFTESIDAKLIKNRLLALPSAQPTQSNDSNTLNALDCISRQAAINALWEALYSYEDKTEKQFIESDELDVGDWILHREFVQNMSDIDRQTILNLPSAQPEQRWIPCRQRMPEHFDWYLVSDKETSWVALWKDGAFLSVSGYFEYSDIIAWMPLPEPARLEKDNGRENQD